MLVQLAIGFITFAIILMLYTILGQYIRNLWMEGFHNGDSVEQSAFIPKVTPGADEGNSSLHPAAAFDTGTETIIEGAKLKAMSLQQARENLGEMTSEKCYRSDIGESLKKTRNYLQRTNNYQHSHPDSCSAPKHEFIGTFYTPFDGVGRTPNSGSDYPASTQYCML